MPETAGKVPRALPSRLHGPAAAAAFLLVLAGLPLVGLAAESKPPDYEECRLQYVYPAGAAVGETVKIELGGLRQGLEGTRSLLIDGPPGIHVRELKNEQADRVTATLEIAADALPGRRSLRVLNDRSGLTNMLYFVVGRLPERLEQEPNDEPSTALRWTCPVVLNGRIHPAADVDCFGVELQQGQAMVAAISAQAIDSHGQGSNYGYVDLELQVLDPAGGVVAEARDTLGLDPLVEWTAARDGVYTVRVNHVLYRGYPEAVYRLTLGDVPIPTSIFPAGGQRGGTVSLEWQGPRLPMSRRDPFAVPAGGSLDSTWWTPAGPSAGDHELPFLLGDLPEAVESEPNDRAEQAESLSLPCTMNGRFQTSRDEDWFRLSLSAGESVCLETWAHRFLHSPADTRLEVFDAQGKKLADNDDGFTIDYMSVHDFQPTDSRLVFTPEAAGDYRVRVTEQSGSAGPRAIYRLSARPAEPDFEIFQYPDAVPIWGPGSTAALYVKVERRHGLESDIDLRVEGLPEGWTGSRAVSWGMTPDRASHPAYGQYANHVFLTITAPAHAPLGDVAEFRVVGRTQSGGASRERIARTMTWYYTSDIGFFRLTPVSRAVVAKAQGPWLSCSVGEIEAARGASVTVPVTVHESGDESTIGLVTNVARSGVACSLNNPATYRLEGSVAQVPIAVPADLPPGDYFVTIARTWRSDIRVGMPGPCVPLIRLRVK